MSAPTYSTAWLELAIIGFLVASYFCWRLSRLHVAAHRVALAATSRREILRAASVDVGWARLVRRALREPAMRDEGASPGYRDAPGRALGPSALALARAERTLIGRRRLLAFAGIGATLLGWAMLYRAFATGVNIMAALAVVFGILVLWNSRRGLTAIDEAQRRLPDLVATLPQTVEIDTPEAMPAVPLTSYGINAFLGLVLIVVFSVIGAALVLQMRTPVVADQIGVVLGVHILVVPLVILGFVLLVQRRIELDAPNAELIVSNRFLRFGYRRWAVPLELGGQFYVVRANRLRTPTLWLKPKVGPPISIADTDLADVAAAKLNAILEKT